jgi:hypothetical protein
MNLEKTKLGESLTLICKSLMMAHWGEILIPGQEYQGEILFKETQIITDYDKYWYYNGLACNSIDWIRKGYNEDNLHEVIPGYIKNSEIDRLYTKKIEMPFIKVKCSDGQTNSFCLLTDEELYRLGAAKGEGGNSLGKPCFCYTVHRVDEYFDYSSIRRDNVLNKILNGSN